MFLVTFAGVLQKKRKENDWWGELNGNVDQPVFLGGAHAEIYKIVHMKFI